MKKFILLALALAACCAVLVGCGCMNTDADVTTLPTNGETSTPPTRPSTVPTTEATTMPQTEPSHDTVPETGSEDFMNPTGGDSTEDTGMLEGAMDEIMGGSNDDSTETTGAGRSRGRMMPGK